MSKKIRITNNGPYEVSGEIPLENQKTLLDDQGFPFEWGDCSQIKASKNYTLCRCGKSKAKPFCDLAHLDMDFDGKETAPNNSYFDRAEKFEGPGLTLYDDDSICAGAGFCDRCTGTWKLTENSDDEDKKKEAIRQSCHCPSGRLVAEDNGKIIEPVFDQSISVVEDIDKENGPLWVKEGIEIESADGKKYETRNRVTLCRCGKSKNKPFCDASHILKD